MTQAEIQTNFDESPCIAALTEGQLLWLLVKIMWNNTQGEVTPMTQADIQAQFDESPCIGGLLKGQLWQLIALLLQDGGGGQSSGFLAQLAGPVSGWPDPPDTSESWGRYNETDGIIYVWDTDAQEWVPSA